MQFNLFKVPIAGPDDVSGVDKLIAQHALEAKDIIAIIGKTEGNGCVNDFTRGYAVRSLQEYFSTHIGKQAAKRISYVMSGGTEGVISPHFTIISRVNNQEAAAVGHSESGLKSLAIGVAHTPVLLPESIGRLAQVNEVADAVGRAMQDARIDDIKDVHFVQIKCPLLTVESIREAESRGQTVVTEETYKSMGFSRGASALGVAVALQEICKDELTEQDICHNWSKYSRVASTSAGSELNYCEIVVFGNSHHAEGELFIEHGVMEDSIDAAALTKLLENHDAEPIQIFAKAEADPSGVIRGRRHTMLDDSDINHTRHARAVVGGVLASVCKDPMIYISGGAEHQGPAGGGPVAVIFRRKTVN